MSSMCFVRASRIAPYRTHISLHMLRAQEKRVPERGGWDWSGHRDFVEPVSGTHSLEMVEVGNGSGCRTKASDRKRARV